ncbi:MAG: hypothetical protein JXR23_11025 [Pontiellaceae bacterium]|nr:hypothetical protein [Pontiellaceae bacterium]
MKKRSFTQYIATVFLFTFFTTIPPFMGGGDISLLLALPLGIPIVLTYNIEPRGAAIASSIAIYLILNLLAFLPILLSPKFKKKKHFITIQTAILVLYIVISIPFILMIGGWMSV